MNWTPAPAVIVTLPRSSPVQVKVGDTFEIALEMGRKWSLASMADAIIRLDSPAGYGDAVLQSCVWHYTALASGQADVEFTGGPLCAKGVRCPVSAPLVKITVQVS